MPEDDENQGGGEKQQGGGKQPKSAKDALGRVQGQIKEAKRKAFEAELKKKAEELNAAETVFNKKTEELAEFIADNEHLYK